MNICTMCPSPADVGAVASRIMLTVDNDILIISIAFLSDYRHRLSIHMKFLLREISERTLRYQQYGNMTILSDIDCAVHRL